MINSGHFNGTLMAVVSWYLLPIPILSVCRVLKNYVHKMKSIWRYDEPVYFIPHFVLNYYVESSVHIRTTL